MRKPASWPRKPLYKVLTGAGLGSSRGDAPPNLHIAGRSGPNRDLTRWLESCAQRRSDRLAHQRCRDRFEFREVKESRLNIGDS